MMYESMIIPIPQKLRFIRSLDHDWFIYEDLEMDYLDYGNLVVLHRPCMTNLHRFRENLIYFSSFNSTENDMKWKMKGCCNGCETLMPLETTKKAIAMATLLCPPWDET